MNKIYLVYAHYLHIHLEFRYYKKYSSYHTCPNFIYSVTIINELTENLKFYFRVKS